MWRFESTREIFAFPKYDAPSCLILDVRLRAESGFAFQEHISRSGGHVPIVFITGHGDIAMTALTIKAGRRGGLSSQAEPRTRPVRRRGECAGARRGSPRRRARERQLPLHTRLLRPAGAGCGGADKQADRSGSWHQPSHGQLSSRPTRAQDGARSVAVPVRKAESLSLSLQPGAQAPHYPGLARPTHPQDDLSLPR